MKNISRKIIAFIFTLSMASLFSVYLICNQNQQSTPNLPQSVTFFFQNDYGNYQAKIQRPHFGEVLENFTINQGSVMITTNPNYYINETYEVDIYTLNGDLIAGHSFHGNDTVQIRQEPTGSFYFMKDGVDSRYIYGRNNYD
jgi:hypothetical protein